MATTDSCDDALAEKYLLEDDFVAKASLDEVSWLVDENGEIDEGASTDTWTTDCLGGGGALDKQTELEAVEKVLDRLLAHGVIEDKKHEGAVNFKFLTTRLAAWRMKDSEWEMTVRFVARKCKWVEHREDLISLGATHPADVGLGDVRGWYGGRTLACS